MPELTPCGGPVDTLAEVAAGVATGAERAQVLAHVMTCESCRQELDELSRTADEVLLVAPEHEPPAGFEAAVLAGIGELSPASSGAMADLDIPSSTESLAPPVRSRRLARSFVLAATAALVGLIGAGTVWQATENDRKIAAAYERTLEVANGQYFSATPFVDSDGTQVGHVFLYQGEPSWVFVVLDEGFGADTYDVVMTTEAGDQTVGVCEATTGSCGVGVTVDVPIAQVIRVALVSQTDGTTINAALREGWPA